MSLFGGDPFNVPCFCSLNPNADPETTNTDIAVDFESLLDYFKSVQERRQAQVSGAHVVRDVGGWY